MFWFDEKLLLQWHVAYNKNLIVNLVDRQVEVYSSPTADGYATRADYQSGQHVPVVLDGTEISQIAVDSLLP